MKISLVMATSVDGIIADKNGSEDFLSHANWQRFIMHSKRAGCFIYARKTYEAVTGWGDEYLKPLDNVTKIVISSKNFRPQKGFELAHSPREAINLLKDKGFDEIIVAGGATLNSSFAKENLLNEIYLFVNPTILGDGLKVLRGANLELNLQLLGAEVFAENIIELHYRVVS